MNIRVSTRAWQFTSIVMTGSVIAVLGLHRLFNRTAGEDSYNFSLLSLAWLMAEILPLLLVVPGMVSGKARSIFWATLFSMLYFIQGVYFAAAPLTRSVGFSEATFSLGLLIACTYLLRGVRLGET